MEALWYFGRLPVRGITANMFGWAISPVLRARALTPHDPL
jgi:hypothetical protein